MSNDVNITSARSKGRPRNEEARLAIVRAACRMLKERGLSGVTMEGVAALAGVGKPTVYRHFNDRHELAMAALMQMATPDRRPATEADPLDEIKQQLFGIAALFESPAGRFATTILASGYGETEISKAFRSHFIERSREQSRMLLNQAKSEGEIDPKADIELALDQLYGALLYRLLIARSMLSRDVVTMLLEQLLMGIRSGRMGPSAKGSR